MSTANVSGLLHIYMTLGGARGSWSGCCQKVCNSMSTALNLWQSTHKTGERSSWRTGFLLISALQLEKRVGRGCRSCSCGPKCHALVLDNQNRWQAPFYLCSQVAAMINAIDSCNWHIIYCRLLIIRIRNVGRSTSCSWRCWRRLNKPKTAAPEWLSSLRLHTEENIRNCTGFSNL